MRMHRVDPFKLHTLVSDLSATLPSVANLNIPSPASDDRISDSTSTGAITTDRDRLLRTLDMHVKSTALLLAMLLSLLLAACDQSTTGGPASGNPDEPERKSMRLISLSPALTQLVSDMGQGDLIVGVDDSHALVFDNLKVPTVGTYDNTSAEAIIELKPTHVLVMAGVEGAPAALQKQAEANGFKVVTFAVPTDVREVIGILMGQFVRPTGDGPGSDRVSSENSLAHLLGNDHSGLVVANEMTRQLGRIAELADSASVPGKRPRVLVVFSLEPRVQAAGPNTVLHDLLQQYAGAYNAVVPEIRPISAAELNAISDPEKRKQAILAAAQDPEKTVGTAPVLDREKLIEAQPQVIVLIMPGEPPLQSIDEDPRLLNLRGLDIPAVKNNRIVLISDKTALLPATTLPTVAAQMAKAIHPSLTAQIDAIFAPVVKPGEKNEKGDNGDKEGVKDESPKSDSPVPIDAR